MDTLQQRFGRAARSPSLEAFSILFVEAKYFEDERKRLEKARQERALKRKRAEDGAEGGPRKRRRRQPAAAMELDGLSTIEREGNPTEMLQEEPMPADEDASEDQELFLHDASTRAKSADEISRKKDIKNNYGDDPAVEAFVNASSNLRKIGCRRKVMQEYFRVKEFGNYYVVLPLAYIESHKPRLQSLTTWNAIQPRHRVVHVASHSQPASAATCAIQWNSNRSSTLYDLHRFQCKGRSCITMLFKQHRRRSQLESPPFAPTNPLRTTQSCSRNCTNGETNVPRKFFSQVTLQIWGPTSYFR